MCTYYSRTHARPRRRKRARRRALDRGTGHVTVSLGVLDELHDDGVAVGEAHLRAGQLGVQAVEQLLGGGVELHGVVVHVGQALAVGGADALRRDAAQRGQPVERHLPCAQPVQPLQNEAEQMRLDEPGRLCTHGQWRAWTVSVRRSCLELPVKGGDEEADELVVRVRGAVRHEWLQEVVDVVVAPCRTPYATSVLCCY